jgi:hypothetical protein
MALRRAEPVSLAAQLFGAHPSRTLALIRAAWPRVVGPELARRTEVVAIEGITLRVRVPDARWQKVLHRMQAELLGRLRAVAGELAPRRLGFVAGSVPDPAPAPRIAPRDIDVPPPSAGLLRAADAIEDPEVRRRFLDTAGRYLARSRKGNADA